jgi:hypothetical protein
VALGPSVPVASSISVRIDDLGCGPRCSVVLMYNISEMTELNQSKQVQVELAGW